MERNPLFSSSPDASPKRSWMQFYMSSLPYFISPFVKPPLKAPEVRELTLAEQEQLCALGESMAQQALGPDWKKPVAKQQSDSSALGVFATNCLCARFQRLGFPRTVHLS
jgi:hypothetical protein